MTSSTDIHELAAALAAAQGTLTGAKRDSVNPHFRSAYADLTSVWDACRDALTKNKLAIAQLPGCDSTGHYVETVLMHASGQWISSRTYTKPVKDDPQGVGSAITYARRYGLAAIVGICPADDDGEAAMGREQSPPARAQQDSKPTKPKATDL